MILSTLCYKEGYNTPLVRYFIPVLVTYIGGLSGIFLPLV